MNVPARENVLGVGVSAVNMTSASALIGDWIERRLRHYVCVTGVHGVMESQGSSELRRAHNEAGMVVPDGMPMAWLLRLGGHRDADRVCGPELMPHLFLMSEQRGYRHFLYGSSEATLGRLRASLAALAPRAVIAGAIAPPFRPLSPEEDAAIVARINEARPDIVWIGLSTPKQELWMASHRATLDAAVLIGVGAAFDIQAGVVPRAPRMIRRTGLEWTYRLAREPRRLWRRYLPNNTRFLGLILLQKLGVLRPAALDAPASSAA